MGESNGSNGKRKLFGTDGIRGVANQHPMTAEVALRLGRAVAHKFASAARRGRIVIGKDTRLSGYMLESALEAGIVSAGADVLLVGPLPTPGIAFITSSMRADAGVVISASHNPYQDNGIKLFASDGFKLPDEVEARDRAADGDRRQRQAARPEIGKATRVADATGRYVQFLKNAFPRQRTLDGVRVVVDCAHGAAYQVAPKVFAELGAEVIELGVKPNGRNINDGCGALHPESLAEEVRRAQRGGGRGPGRRRRSADPVRREGAGRATATRSWPSWARACWPRTRCPGRTVVATVMSNLGLERALARQAGASCCGRRWAIATWSRPCASTGTCWGASSRVTWCSWTSPPPATASWRRCGCWRS